MKTVEVKGQNKFFWTVHAKEKMQYYRLSPSRILRAFHHPARVEDGVAPKTTALMQPLTPKHTSEIWLMYQHDKAKGTNTIISVWRYPAKSPTGKAIPIPEEIRKELNIKVIK
ncbi:MAG: hypothetical protein WC310_01805 [Patescibacteria group bacterium]|jgi:hypothetical protein